MKAVIDIGSNSIMCLIGEIQDGQIKTHYEQTRITSLGKGLSSSSSLNPSSIQDSLVVLREFKKVIEQHSVTDIVITATEALRRALDAPQFITRVKQELNFEIILLNPQGEAYFTALGVAVNSSQKEFQVIDMGGASTEIIKIKKRPFGVDSSISIPLGAAIANDYFQNNDKSSLEKILQNLDISEYENDNIVGVAGGIVSLACMLFNIQEYKTQEINGLKIGLKQLYNLQDTITDLSVDELMKLYPFLGKRAEVIQAGLFLLLSLLEKMSVKNILISTNGLRHGLIFSDSIQKEYIL